MTRVVGCGAACIVALTASLAAQNPPSQPQPKPTPNPTSPTYPQPAPSRPAAESQAPMVTVEGCLYREVEVPGRAIPEADWQRVNTDNDYVLKQVVDLLQSKLHRRGVPLKALTYGKIEPASGGTVRQRVSVQQGIPMDKAKEIVRLIKDAKLKVQAQIQEDQVRVFGKNRDDLQTVIRMLREQDLGIEMQFTNYRSE